MKATLTHSFIELVAYGQIGCVLLFISWVVPGTEVGHFGGFFPPSSAYPPSSPCIVSYLLFLSIFPSASLGMFPIQNWQEEKLPFVSPFPPHLC